MIVPLPLPTLLLGGREVQNAQGSAGAPLVKRALLAILVAQVVGMPRVEHHLLHRLQALFVHPVGHRKELMCVWHRAYQWVASLPPGKWVKWGADIRNEFAAALLLLPFAQVDTQAPLSNTISCIDATASRGARSSGLQILIWPGC